MNAVTMNEFVMNFEFEGSAIDQLVTALVVAPVQAAIGLLVLLGSIVRLVALAVRENGAILVRFAGIIAVTLILATQPQIAIAVALIAAYVWITKP